MDSSRKVFLSIIKKVCQSSDLLPQLSQKSHFDYNDEMIFLPEKGIEVQKLGFVRYN